jgi:hypothetical protein
LNLQLHSLFTIDTIGIGKSFSYKNIFLVLLFNSMQQGKMFFIMGLCMALVQGGYVRRIPHGKEIIAAMSVSNELKSVVRVEVLFAYDIH